MVVTRKYKTLYVHMCCQFLNVKTCNTPAARLSGYLPAMLTEADRREP